MASSATADESRSAEKARPARADRRTALLDAAVVRFVAVGIAKTTMEDIAREAGAGKATLYRHFPNKAAVVEALVERENRRFERTLRRAVDGAVGHSAAVEDAFVAALGFLRSHPMLNKSLAEEPHTVLPYLTLRTGPLAQSTLELFRELVEGGIAARVFRPVRADWAAETLFRLLMSFFSLPAMAVDVDDPEEIRAYARGLVAGGLERADVPPATARW